MLGLVLVWTDLLILYVFDFHFLFQELKIEHEALQTLYNETAMKLKQITTELMDTVNLPFIHILWPSKESINFSTIDLHQTFE